MPRLLRTINRKWWYSAYPWILEGELQAEALINLNAERNELSFWHIEDDGSNFNDVLIAIASNRKTPSDFSYAILDEEIVVKLTLKVKPTLGTTPYRQGAAHHRLIYELTTDKLSELAKAIKMKPYKTDRILWKDVHGLLSSAINDGKLHVEEMRGQLKNEFTLPPD